jgi:hypothetical protein
MPQVLYPRLEVIHACMSYVPFAVSQFQMCVLKVAFD